MHNGGHGQPIGDKWVSEGGIAPGQVSYEPEAQDAVAWAYAGDQAEDKDAP